MKHLSRNTRLQIRLSVIFIILFVLSFTYLSIGDSNLDPLYAPSDVASEEQLMVKRVRQETLLSKTRLHVITTEFLSILTKMQSAIISSFTVKSRLMIEGDEKDDHRYLKLVETALDLGLDTSILSFKSTKTKKSQQKKSKIEDINVENTFGTSTADSKLGSENISKSSSNESMPANRSNILTNLPTILEKNISQLDTSDVNPTITTKSYYLDLEVKRLAPVIDGKSISRKTESKDIPLMGVDENNNPVVMRPITSTVSEKIGQPNRNAYDTPVKGETSSSNISSSSSSSSSNSDSKRVSGVSNVSQVKAAPIKSIQFKNISINTTTMNISSENVDGKLFYMYDLDEEFWWRWPHPDADCR